MKEEPRYGGDAPIGASWYIQSIDQAPLALATGAHFVPVRTIDRALDCVREAFYVARAERRPAVLSVPLDLQTEEFPYLPDYTPSAACAGAAARSGGRRR
jgi:acetolactate synthase I/II/III large subunit